MQPEPFVATKKKKICLKIKSIQKNKRERREEGIGRKGEREKQRERSSVLYLYCFCIKWGGNKVPLRAGFLSLANENILLTQGMVNWNTFKYYNNNMPCFLDIFS